MSLINQMLQDLDKRGAHAASHESMPDQIMAIPGKKKPGPVGMVVLAGVILGVSIVAVLSWYFAKVEPTVIVNKPASQSGSGSGSSVVTALSRNNLPPKSATVTITSAPMPAILTPAPVPAYKLTIDAGDQSAEQAGATVNAPKNAVSSPPVQQQAGAPAPAPGWGIKKSALPEVLSKVGVAVPAAKSDPDAAESAGNEQQIKEVTPAQRVNNDYRQALQLLQQGLATEAMLALEKLLIREPRHAEVRQTLVVLLLQNRRTEEAMRRLQEGLDLTPDFSDMAMTLSRLQVDKGDNATAIATLQRTLPYAGERADYQAFLAALLQRESKHKEASEHYLVALRKQPKNGLWWMGLGISLEADHRLLEAQEAFGRAKTTGMLTPELQAFVEQKTSRGQP